jgi:hypothetical protein
MDRFFVSCPITYRLGYFYLGIATFPFLIVIACLICYCVAPNRPSTLPPGAHIPTYSELVEDTPQSRIWAVGMTVQGIFLLLFGVLRDHVVTVHLSSAVRISRRICNVLMELSRVLILLASFALMLLACIPISSLRAVHASAAGVFFGSLSLYFFVGDYLTWKMKQPLKIASVGLTGANVICVSVAVIVRYANDSPAAYDASSVLSYIAVAGLFAKLVVLRMDMPKHGIRLSRKTGADDTTEHENAVVGAY